MGRVALQEARGVVHDTQIAQEQPRTLDSATVEDLVRATKQG